MKEIELTQGYVALVDDEDYDALMKYKWSISKQKGRIYTQTVYEKNKRISMHRYLMGSPEGMDIDHKDHNGLNNQRNNLRVCTRSQNNVNSSAVRGLSKYKGVYYGKNRGPNRRKYCANIKVNGKKITRWRETEEQAAHAYDELALKYYGEFAYLNFNKGSIMEVVIKHLKCKNT